ncbi:MAG: hypothetical protein DRN18_01955 [Thermoplasmata archaeon]|nr:MAG: hypothetical protein DRN18_01955 [Thermoplasmata archaeon]
MSPKHVHPFLLAIAIVITLSVINNLARSEGAGNTLTSENRWVKVFGGNEPELSYRIRQTNDEGYILVVGTPSYGAGEDDIWLIKLDGNGRKEWDRLFGGKNSDFPFCVEQTSDGGYIIAGFTGSYGHGSLDAWLIKTDERGNEVWNKTFGGEKKDRALWVEQTRDGGYIIAGDTMSFGDGKNNGWVIKVDDNGKEEWNKTFDEKGKIVVLNCIHQTKDGGYIAGGGILDPESHNLSALLIKLSTDGKEEWKRVYNYSDYINIYRILPTSDGGYIMVGAKYIHDIIIKTDENGDIEWSRTLFNEDKAVYSIATAIEQTSDGGYIVTGWRGDKTWIYYIIFPFINPHHYFPKAWIVKLDKDGNKEWISTFFGIGYWMWSFDVQQTIDGGYIVCGMVERYNCWNESDVVLIKTDSEGRTNFLQLRLCGIIHWFVKQMSTSDVTSLKSICLCR